MPPSDGARARLRASQDAVVGALLADGALPPGFDPAVMARARKKLLEKRAWVDARRAQRRRVGRLARLRALFQRWIRRL